MKRLKRLHTPNFYHTRSKMYRDITHKVVNGNTNMMWNQISAFRDGAVNKEKLRNFLHITFNRRYYGLT
jgi:hypothetical protein